jgi:hypothetical protein
MHMAVSFESTVDRLKEKGRAEVLLADLANNEDAAKNFLTAAAQEARVDVEVRVTPKKAIAEKK